MPVSRRKDILAIVLLAGAVLALVSLHSSAGVVGLYLAGALRWSVGQAADLPPLLCALGAVVLLRERGAGRRRKAAAIALLFIVFTGMLQIVHETKPRTGLVQVLPPEGVGGGVLGELVAHALLQAFGLLGSGIVLVALALISAVLFADTPIARLVEKMTTGVAAFMAAAFRFVWRGGVSLCATLRDTWRDWRDARAVRKAERGALPDGWLARVFTRRYQSAPLAAALEQHEVTSGRPRTTPALEGDSKPVLRATSGSTNPADSPPDAAKKRGSSRKTPLSEGFVSLGGKRPPSRPQATKAGPDLVTGEAGSKAATAAAAGASPPLPPQYQLPPIALFARPKSKRRLANMPDQREQLEETLATFGVAATVVSVSRGPVVTRYELQPAPGVAVKRITSLADDLALNLAAAGVRIEAPVPGKSVVGIEVPNKETALVTFREVADTDAFAKSRSRLAIALGTDIAGNPVIGDLTKWLHLLIAGATGSGKSVCINTIICSLLVKARPDEVKLLLVDPKRVELAVYDGIPHLIAPVVTDPKQASGALRWAVREMESRFKQFADRGVRNIDGYNQLVLHEEPGGEPLPHVVVIIDELADLMMVARADVEDSICRLAQMARAAGMFLIVATQRPSVDVITGLIKANVPSRISFAVSSGTDSRTILDHVGAERLLGKGDMLYHPIGLPKPVRAQGAFISDQEVAALVDFWKVQGTPEYQEEVLAEPATDVESGVGENDDELFGDACRLVVETGTASISMIQRRFRVGYARAARLIDMMELRGIVGPYQGSKPREVLRTADELEEMVL